MARAAKIRIVIADDQPLMRSGLRMVIESQPDLVVVGEASDGAQALTLVRTELSDVVLMDIQMPRVNGLVSAARIADDAAVAALGRPPRVILLTAVEVDDHIAAAATAGVFAVLFKDIDPEDLLSTIRSAARSA